MNREGNRVMSMKAGVALEDITPPAGVTLFGHPRVRRDMAGVHDPLQARAIHIRTGSGGLIFVSLDLFDLEPYTCGQICKAIQESTGIKKEHIFLGCTNTHSGPATVWPYAWKGDDGVLPPDSAYLESVKQAAVSAAASACATTQPVGVTATTVSHSGVDGSHKAHTDILALKLEETGLYTGIILISDLLPAAVAPDSTEISADVPFFVRKQLTERYGDQLIVVQYTAPCAGQKMPYFVDKDPFGIASSTGMRAAESVALALSSASQSAFRNDLNVTGLRKELRLSFRKLPDVASSRAAVMASQAEATQLLKEGANEGAFWKANCALARTEGVANLVRQQEDGVLDQLRLMYGAAEISVLRVGEITFVGLPGSLATSYASDLKKQVDGRIFVASHVNGFLQGDIPDPKMEVNGQFGILASPFSTSGVEKMVKAAISLVKETAAKV